MYESPIQIIEKDIQLQMEENICKAVKEVGISVDKDELIKALKYDREQYAKGFEDGRADAINECLVIINKIMPPQPYLLKSKHYENWKMKTTELRMLRDMIEQLKEQKCSTLKTE